MPQQWSVSARPGQLVRHRHSLARRTGSAAHQGAGSEAEPAQGRVRRRRTSQPLPARYEGSSDSLASPEKGDFSQKKTGVTPNMIGVYRFFYDKINELLNDASVDMAIEEEVEALFSSLKNDLTLVSSHTR